MRKKRLILISSSSGGHAIPINEIYKAVTSYKNISAEIFQSGSDIEKNVFFGTRNKKIISGKYHRFQDLKNIGQFIKIGIGFVQVIFEFIFKRPDLIFSKGGFLSVPILTIAKILRIPYFLHESDSVMGVSNKLFVRSAKKVFVSFPLNMYDDVIQNNFIYSGLIIRPILKLKIKSKEKDKIIFIAGGSQGAHKINQIIFSLLPDLLKKYKIVHQVGKKDNESAKENLKKIDFEKAKNYSYFDFSVEKYLSALLSADLVISRAGATAIGEIAKAGKASIIIPYPYAASNHQLENGRFIEKSHAGILLTEDNLTESNLLERINFVFSDTRNFEVFSRNIKKAIKTDGLGIILSHIIKYFEEEK